MMLSLHVVVHCREAIHSGETVMVSPTGQVQLPGESDDPYPSGNFGSAG